MRTLSMFLTLGIFVAFGAVPAEAARTTNAHATVTTSNAADPQVLRSIGAASLGSSCPTVLVGKDKMPIAVCSRTLGQAPVVRLFDESGSTILATRVLDKNTVVDGNPAYLDRDGWLVIVNGDRVIWRLTHDYGVGNKWNLFIGRSAVLAEAVASSDRVVGLQPDSAGRVWFGTANGVIGTVDTTINRVKRIRLPHAEGIVRDLSATDSRIVATSARAFYTLQATSKGIPTILKRRAR